MKLVIAGIAPDGRSAVDRIVEGNRSEGLAADRLWSTDVAPPSLDRRHHGPGPALDVGCPPNGTTWLRVTLPPGEAFDIHWTETLDYDIVLEGGLELVLEHDTVELGPGDAVLIPGVRHGWRAGPEGCTYAVVLQGLGAAPQNEH